MLATLLAWGAGWLWTDTWAWSQFCWWGGVPLLLLAGALLGLSAWASWLWTPPSQPRRRWLRSVALWLFVAACAGETWHQLNGRAVLARSDPAPRDNLLVVQWNYSGGPMPDPDAMADRLASTGVPDLVLVSMQNYPAQWDAIKRVMSETPGVKVDMGFMGVTKVFSRLPITSFRQFVVPTPPSAVVRLPRWADAVLNAIITSAGVYPRDAERIEAASITVLELDGAKRFDRPVVVYFVDYPSSPLIHRRRVAEAVRDRIGQITRLNADTETGERPVPPPDLIIGDFNTPRGSGSVLELMPGFTPVSDSAGLGLLRSFPRRTPLLHIDNALISPAWRGGQYRLIDPGLSEHRAQRMRIWPEPAAN